MLLTLHSCGAGAATSSQSVQSGTEALHKVPKFHSVIHRALHHLMAGADFELLAIPTLLEIHYLMMFDFIMFHKNINKILIYSERCIQYNMKI